MSAVGSREGFGERRSTVASYGDNRGDRHVAAVEPAVRGGARPWHRGGVGDPTVAMAS
jgi:hypothetical protein